MIKKIKKASRSMSSVIISELIVVPLAFSFMSLSMAPIVNFSQEILPPPDPQIESIMANPDLNLLIIEGTSSFTNEPIWLEDVSKGEIIQLTSDSEGHFEAALDSSFLTAQAGSHDIITYVGVTSVKTPLQKSNQAVYSIDEEYNVILDTTKSKGITLLSNNVIAVDVAELQDKYQLKVVSVREEQPAIYKAVSYQGVSTWQNVIKILAYVLALLIIFLAIYKRWRRKKNQGKSFWSLGKGIYINPQSPKN